MRRYDGVNPRSVRRAGALEHDSADSEPADTQNVSGTCMSRAVVSYIFSASRRNPFDHHVVSCVSMLPSNPGCKSVAMECLSMVAVPSFPQLRSGPCFATYFSSRLPQIMGIKEEGEGRVLESWKGEEGRGKRRGTGEVPDGRAPCPNGPRFPRNWSLLEL